MSVVTRLRSYGGWQRLLDALILLTVVVAVVRLSDGRGSRVQPAPWLAVGSAISVPGIEWADADVSVVLAMTTSCQYCENSGPLYGRLAAWIRTQPRHRFVAVAPERGSVIAEWMRRHGIHNYEHARANFHLHGFRLTPTIVFVDRTGTVTDMAIGELSEAEEAAVFERLEGRAPQPLQIRAELSRDDPHGEVAAGPAEQD